MALRDESVSLQDLHNNIMALVDALVPPVRTDADNFWFVESFRAVLISVASCNARTKTKETAAAVKPAGAIEHRKG